MSSTNNVSRRQFISAVASTAAISYIARPVLSFGAFQGSDSVGNLPWKDQGVLNLVNSPFAKLHSVPVRAVTIEEGFWSQRRKTNVKSSIPSMRKELEQHGRMDNYRRLVGKSSEPQKGPYYSDSDIYKWIEAVGWELQSGDRPELRSLTDSMIREVVAIQEPSGYLNTYFVDDKKSQRMEPHIQEVGHELYCLGHMIQGAVAYYRATGDSTLLDAGAKFVDGFVIPNYGPDANKKPIISGHPEIEMALIELYRTTGKRQYVELAGYILHGDERATIKPRAIVYTNLRNPVYDPNQARRPCCTRNVRLLRRNRLLSGNRRSRILEGSEHALGRSLKTADVCHRRRRCAERRRSFRRALRAAQRGSLWRKLRCHRQHDVELAHVGCQRRSKIHRCDRARAI